MSYIATIGSLPPIHLPPPDSNDHARTADTDTSGDDGSTFDPGGGLDDPPHDGKFPTVHQGQMVLAHPLRGPLAGKP